MQALHWFLPRLDHKRGLINLDGTVLKTLFGTATVLDIDELHNALNWNLGILT
jgi:hypothetical protein